MKRARKNWLWGFIEVFSVIWSIFFVLLSAKDAFTLAREAVNVDSLLWIFWNATVDSLLIATAISAVYIVLGGILRGAFAFLCEKPGVHNIWKP